MISIASRLARAAPVALLALAAAGCSSSSTSSASATSVPLATAPVISPHATPTATPAISPGGLVVVPAGAQVTVIAPLGLNLRAGPSTTSAVVGSLGQGAVLSVLAHQTGWYSVMGATKQGYVTDNPQFLSPRHFNTFTSSVNAFTLLYPDTWAFAETTSGVEFRPQTGPQVMTVRTAATLAALGPPGRSGYALVATDSTEVYGVTGVLRTFDASAGAPAGTSAPITGTGSSTASATTSGTSATAALAHLQEIRLTVKTTFAMQIDYLYNDAADLAVFMDMLNSIYLPAASATPAPTPAPTP